ncbi:MAG TPA: MBL fold metallo-hydrolase [Acidimicrobiales bacterium]|nr:MBL fold metallo-hydrolase [Acidimicrobiales bacterium]
MTDLEPGEVVEVATAVRRIVAPNPSVMTGPGTNTYLVGEGDVAVIDPGPEDTSHLDAIVAAGGGRVRYVLVTHTHPDHSPGAAALGERTGATLLGYSEKDGFVPGATLADGDVVAGDGFRLRAVHTPGHASNHLCYLLEGEDVLFTGDHIMGGSTVVIAPLDGDMADYLASLRRIRAFDPPVRRIAPGHGPMMEDPAAVIDWYVEHRLAREGAIADSLRSRGSATIDEILPDAYKDVDEALYPIARYSVWAHLRKLAEDGRAEADDAGEIATTWRHR